MKIVNEVGTSEDVLFVVKGKANKVSAPKVEEVELALAA